jgi:2',3'-cyclic-nucleotide 2'-phosphodiesterase (5'-nucleotidase family)
MLNHKWKILLLVLLIAAASCNKSYYAARYDYKRYKIDVEDIRDRNIQSMIEPYKTKLDSEMNSELAYCEVELTKDRPESTLGNLVAQFLLEKAATHSGQQADFSIVNFGGIRLPQISPGNITVGKVYELMPFDNTLVVMELDAKTVTELMDVMAASGGWPIAGASYVIENKKANNIRIGGQPLVEEKTYRVVLSSYLADGGDRLEMLRGKEVKELNVLLRDALIEAFRERGLRGEKISAVIDGRVTEIK